MKLLCLLAFCALAVAAVPLTERINGENGWYVPQLNGTAVWMDMDVAENMLAELEMEESRKFTTVPVKYYLYTRKNPKKGQKIKATYKSINKSNFNPEHPTRFVIHGFIQSHISSMNKQIRNAWLNVGEYNVIVVDWARARSIDYASSVLAVPRVGAKIAELIDYLVEGHDMSLDTLTVIGHSLGAHVAGYVGKNLQSGEIFSIVGLDVAFPLFSYNNPDKRLCDDDASYVESIHTNGGKLGFLHPIGRGAFYPNGGKSQPGCILDVTGACSHERSITYYAEAVEANSYPTVKCEDYKSASKNKCGSTYSSIRMGSQSNSYVVDGEYYVPVNKKSPYGMAA